MTLRKLCLHRVAFEWALLWDWIIIWDIILTLTNCHIYDIAFFMPHLWHWVIAIWHVTCSKDRRLCLSIKRPVLWTFYCHVGEKFLCGVSIWYSCSNVILKYYFLCPLIFCRSLSNWNIKLNIEPTRLGSFESSTLWLSLEPIMDHQNHPIDVLEGL